MNHTIQTLALYASSGLTICYGAGKAPLDKQQIRNLFDGLPLTFEANQGQLGERGQFLSRGPGYALYLSASEAILVTGQRSRRAIPMQLVGADSKAEGQGMDPLPSQTYYFTGNGPAKWRSKVPSYNRVRYRAVYPGVDLVYYGNQGQLEYDFIVASGADPERIRLRFPELRRIRIDTQTGDLRLDSGEGEVLLHKPVAYQEGPRRQSVAARYVFRPGKQVGIELASYDHTRPLIIDPVLSLDYATYLGGSSADAAYAIVVDDTGNAYVGGGTESSNFPVVNSLPPSNNHLAGNQDAFVCKLNFNQATSQLSLVWSAFLGGSNFDVTVGLALNASGDIYVTGATNSPDFPTLHPLPSPFDVYRGDNDTFVTKLSFNSVTSTLSLVYSTYIGGWASDIVTGIGIDGTGNAYVAGNTCSSNFPIVHPLPSPYGTFRGCDLFISKLIFDPATSALSLGYSTFLGGSGNENIGGIAVDPGGNVYITGVTQSADYPTVHPLPAPNNAFQGEADVVVSKISFDAATFSTSLVWSTYLGGSGFDLPSGMAVDPSGSVYVTGMTYSNNFPAVNPLPAPNNALQGDVDAFISKLSYNPLTSTLSLIYSTFLGGSGNDWANTIAVDSTGNAYVAGPTLSANFPTASPLPSTNCGPTANAGFAAKVSYRSSPPQLSLPWSTCLSTGTLNVRRMAVDKSGSAYMVAQTFSNNFPVVNPLPAPNNTLQGPSDGIVFKVTATDPVAAFASASAKLEIRAQGFELNESFTLGAASNGINPLNQDVTVQIGTYSVTVPAGSFQQNPNGRYTFSGVINHVNLTIQIAPQGGSTFDFKVETTGVNLSTLPKPITIVLTIGDDSGSTTSML